MSAPRPGTRAHARALAALLERAYGPLPWRRRHPPVDELVTTMLSHSTTDANQFRAFDTLRERFPTWDAVRAAPTSEVEDAVRVAGLANQKAPRIQAVLDTIVVEPRGADLEWLGDVSLDEAMAYLTALPGVGPKTAACVLCFSFDRPVLPADTHVHRIALRTHVVPPGASATRAQERLSRFIAPEDVYQTHMHLIRHGRETCHARGPACGSCPLSSVCPERRTSS